MQGVAFYTSRLMDSVTITPETLRQTEERLAEAAALILPGLALDVIAFTCTSAAIVNGEDRIFARIHERRPGVPCTTPITAGLAAMRALDLARIALLTPYVQEINEMMRAYIERRGIAVPVMGSFNNSNDNEVARISPASIRDAVYELARPADVDGVFVSCGSLRVVDMVEEIEQAIGKPVTSSNHALAWHSLRIAGYRDPVPGFGRLFRT
jgi:maleate isomerase